jgi:transposase
MVDESTSDDKKSGYKRAPGNGRFKPGASGNPSGRPKGSRNLRTELKEVMSETVVIRKNGKTKSVRSIKAIFMRLRQMAIEGDLRAIVKLIHTEITLNPVTSTEDAPEEILPENDKAIIAAFLQDAATSKTHQEPLQAPSSENMPLAAGDRTAAHPDGHRDLDARISAEHPLRRLRDLADAAIASLDAELGSNITDTRPAVSLNKLLRAWLLRLFYTIQTDVVLIEELEYNQVYRWFVGLRLDESLEGLAEFTDTLHSLHSGRLIGSFKCAFFADKDFQTFLLSDQASFSMLARLARFCGYLPQRAVGANNDDN